MRHIYTFLLLAILGLSMASCSDDKRDIVFFTGDAPIYQTGTCVNLISSVSLYPIKPEGENIGIDGGNGDYSIIGNTDEAVVAVVMTVSEKYKRLQITPKDCRIKSESQRVWKKNGSECSRNHCQWRGDG